MLGNLRTAPVMLKSTAMRLNARSASSLPKKALDSLKNAMKQDDRKSTTADMIKQVNDNRKETKNQTGKTEPQPCEGLTDLAPHMQAEDAHNVALVHRGDNHDHGDPKSASF